MHTRTRARAHAHAHSRAHTHKRILAPMNVIVCIAAMQIYSAPREFALMRSARARYPGPALHVLRSVVRALARTSTAEHIRRAYASKAPKRQSARLSARPRTARRHSRDRRPWSAFVACRRKFRRGNMPVLAQAISACSCESNWSAHWHINSEVRDRLAPATTEKPV